MSIWQLPMELIADVEKQMDFSELSCYAYQMRISSIDRLNMLQQNLL